MTHSRSMKLKARTGNYALRSYTAVARCLPDKFCQFEQKASETTRVEADD